MAGDTLEPALHALAEWAQCNIEAEVFLDDLNVSTLMWAVRRKIDVSELPRRRTVILFQFNEEPRPEYPRYWLLTEPGAALPEICAYDPGLDDLFVETSTISLGAIIMGKTMIESEIGKWSPFPERRRQRCADGRPMVRRSCYASLDGIAKLPTEPP